jgi:zinc transport system ATP-binding protein
MANTLEVTGLTVTLGATTVLRDVSFTVPEGASLAIIGPNGSGKTVLLRALIGALPSAGTIRWAPGVRLGYVPQKLDVSRDVPITGRDFLAAGARLGHRDAGVTDVLALVGLPAELVDQSIGKLSGGQFQRLLIAFALIGAPTVLLLDEPTAGVDEPGQERLNELVDRLKRERGMTVLLVSHELTVVDRFATLVLCLGHGTAWVGPPHDALSPGLLQQLYGAPPAYHVHDH